MSQADQAQHYMVLCPDCGNLVLTKWVEYEGVGGIEPVGCPCGHMILVESEADHKPVEVAAA